MAVSPGTAGRIDDTASNTNTVEYILHHTMTITYTLIDQLLEEYEMGALQQLLPEDQPHSLKC